MPELDIKNKLDLLQSQYDELNSKFIELQKQNIELEEKLKCEFEKNKIKDKQMVVQSRLAQMGEMISMIAHQWRQPLSAISATAASLSVKANLGRANKEFVLQQSNKISNYSQHLSTTIDDFRDFFKPNKDKQKVDFSYIVKSVFGIVKVSLKNKNIRIIKHLSCDKKFYSYSNELKQVVLNILKNAEDALIERDIENPYIKIESYCENDNIVLQISDNAQGIEKNTIDKIFDPYFSTKLKKNGTGLGLYMSKMIIEEHCEGKLLVENGKDGAVFKIILQEGSLDD